MDSLFDINGLMFWSAREIRLRRRFEDHFAAEIQNILLVENPAWRFVQIEGPQLTPRANINPNYTENDVWIQHTRSIVGLGEDDNIKHEPELVLRPETTPSSYVYAQHLLNSHSGIKPPFVVWQAGKSFRREQDQVTKNMRLKEFYQQEFQCIYTADTKNDYHSAILDPVRIMLGEMVGVPTRLVESDRLPSYSLKTMDVEAWCQCSTTDDTESFEIQDYHLAENSAVVKYIEDYYPPDGCRDGKWMEVCSISIRTDFPDKARFQTKKGIIEKDLLVLEISIGLDRCVYNFEQRSEFNE